MRDSTNYIVRFDGSLTQYSIYTCTGVSLDHAIKTFVGDAMGVLDSIKHKAGKTVVTYHDSLTLAEKSFTVTRAKHQ